MLVSGRAPHHFFWGSSYGNLGENTRILPRSLDTTLWPATRSSESMASGNTLRIFVSLGWSFRTQDQKKSINMADFFFRAQDFCRGLSLDHTNAKNVGFRFRGWPAISKPTFPHGRKVCRKSRIASGTMRRSWCLWRWEKCWKWIR